VPPPAARVLREAVRERLIRWGGREILGETIISRQTLAALSPEGATVPAGTLIIDDQGRGPVRVVRPTLLVGLLHALRRNLESATGLRLFTVGVVAERGFGDPERVVHREQVALAIAGHAQAPSVHDRHPRQLDFYDGSAAVAQLVQAAGAPEPVLVPEVIPPYQPGQSAQVVSGGVRVGSVGALHPFVATRFDLDGPRVICAVVDLAALSAAVTDRPTVLAEPPRTPPLTLDVTVTVDRDVTAGELVGALREGAGPLLERIDVIDVYRNGGLVSMTCRACFRAVGRTLRTAEARERLAAGAALAARRYGAVVAGAAPPDDRGP
jgi:phenylalanyl-tRNA synthetase beta chain